MGIVAEIYESLLDVDLNRLYANPDVEKAAQEYRRVIDRHVPLDDYDNVTAAITQYGETCSRVGFEDGFRTAWRLIEEMSGGKLGDSGVI